MSTCCFVCEFAKKQLLLLNALTNLLSLHYLPRFPFVHFSLLLHPLLQLQCDLSRLEQLATQGLLCVVREGVQRAKFGTTGPL